MKNLEAPANALPVLMTDIELAPKIRVSAGFLQKDRREGMRIPFVRIGDRCLYDPVAVAEALKAMTVGGQSSRRRKVAEGSVQGPRE